jgi:hypothetical protein
MHGAVDFVPVLTAFMSKNLPLNTIPPGRQDRFDVFKEVVITAPAAHQVGKTRQQWHVRATPAITAPASSRKPGLPAQFDMALISKTPKHRQQAWGTLNGL